MSPGWVFTWWYQISSVERYTFRPVLVTFIKFSGYPGSRSVKLKVIFLKLFLFISAQNFAWLVYINSDETVNRKLKYFNVSLARYLFTHLLPQQNLKVGIKKKKFLREIFETNLKEIKTFINFPCEKWVISAVALLDCIPCRNVA